MAKAPAKNSYQDRKAKAAVTLEEFRALPEEERLDLSGPHWGEKQRLFVYHFKKTLNATRAARYAGYSNPDVEGYRLQQVPHIAAHLEVWQAQRLAKYNITADRIIGELAAIAFGGMADLTKINDAGELVFDFDNASVDDLNSIAEITSDTYLDRSADPDGELVKSTRIKRYDRLKALEMLGKLTKFKLFRDSVEVSGDIAMLLSEARQRRREMLAAQEVRRLEAERDAPPMLEARPMRDVTPTPAPASKRDVKKPGDVARRDVRRDRLREALKRD